MSRETALELHDIQGNVLRGYGLPTAAYVNVRIGNAREGRRLLDDLRRTVEDARSWDHAKPVATVNVAVSHEGLCRLGVPESILRTFPPEFRQGMAARSEHLGDYGRSAPERWQKGLRGGDIQLLFVLHAQSCDQLCGQVAWLKDRVTSHRKITVDEPELAAVLGSGDDPTREHFGYKDGFGQPAIAGAPGKQYRGQGVALERNLRPLRLHSSRCWPLGVRTLRVRRGWRSLAAGEFVLGYRDDDGVMPRAPAAPVGRNGTFMVFRKLHQDVAAFRRLLKSIAYEHFSGDEELAAAKLAGRWRDSTPVRLYAGGDRDREPKLPKTEINDFRYRDDHDGSACPLGAHIRRANPRDAMPGGSERSRRHRIIRRGMPYGPPLAPGRFDDDGCDRGLIFVCFNASIARQFEAVNRWLLDGDPFTLAEADALTAHKQDLMTVQGEPPSLLEIEPLVWTRGGEYLFLPGLTALEALSDPNAAGPMDAVRHGRRR
jgi:Dyp-type peroxidase family